MRSTGFSRSASAPFEAERYESLPAWHGERSTILRITDRSSTMTLVFFMGRHRSLVLFIAAAAELFAVFSLFVYIGDSTTPL